jgi:hypothetical protein
MRYLCGINLLVRTPSMAECRLRGGGGGSQGSGGVIVGSEVDEGGGKGPYSTVISLALLIYGAPQLGVQGHLLRDRCKHKCQRTFS